MSLALPRSAQHPSVPALPAAPRMTESVFKAIRNRRGSRCRRCRPAGRKTASPPRKCRCRRAQNRRRSGDRKMCRRSRSRALDKACRSRDRRASQFGQLSIEAPAFQRRRWRQCGPAGDGGLSRPRRKTMPIEPGPPRRRSRGAREIVRIVIASRKGSFRRGYSKPPRYPPLSSRTIEIPPLCSTTMRSICEISRMPESRICASMSCRVMRERLIWLSSKPFS